MRTKLTILTSLTLLGLNACGDEATSAATISAGGAINNISTAMSSISDLASASLMSSDNNFEILSGVASTYCSGNGEPKVGDTTVDSGDDEYAGGTGFCQATANSQSPDTARGAMYLAGGVACEAEAAGLFNGLTAGSSNTVTKTITFSTACWGTQAEVDAFVADSGASVDNLGLTVEALSSGDYNYKLTYALPGDGDTSVYLASSSGVYAALSEDGWYVKMDTSAGTIMYEGVNPDNHRRIRLLINGTISGSTFSALTSIKGFQMEGNSSNVGSLATYEGNLSAGLKGNTYNVADNSGTDVTDKCYLPGGTGTCTGFTGITSSDAEASALYSALSTALANLIAETSTFISITDVDPAVTDITQ